MSVWDKKQASKDGLERENEAFSNSDATFFPDGAVARLFDALATAPFAEWLAVELYAAIADNVFRSCLNLGYRSAQEGSHGQGGWLLFERSYAHGAA